MQFVDRRLTERVGRGRKFWYTEDKYIEGFKKLNDVVHDVGEKTCIQLWQGGLAVALD